MKKKIDHLGLVAFNMHAQGLQFGQDFAHLDPMPQIEDGQAAGSEGRARGWAVECWRVVNGSPGRSSAEAHNPPLQRTGAPVGRPGR